MKSIPYETILKSHAFSDFKLFVNGQTFLLHRAILNQRCKYFQKLFQNDPSLMHTQIQLPEDLLVSFDSLLLWIYGSKNFHVQPEVFCHLTRLALFFDAPSLLDSLLFWMSSNLDYFNVLDFYCQLLPYKDELPSFFSTFLKTFIRYFENIDFNLISKCLPFDFFYEIITDKRLCASSYKKSLATVIYLDTNKNLKDEEKTKLLDFYLQTDWIVKISTIYINSTPEKKSDLIHFAAHHFSSITLDELKQLPQEALIELLNSANLDLRNDSDLVKKCKILSDALECPENDQRIKEIWSCVIQNDQNAQKKCERSRKFSKRTPSTKTLRCLVLGSVMDDMLDDVEQTLIENGLQKKNIVLINGDIMTPTLDFFFQFDVVFVFTHYQFQSPKVISELLTKFAIHRGGGIVAAFGFMRDDDWGCGDEELMKLMPFTRGPPDLSIENTTITIHERKNDNDNVLNFLIKKMENMDKIKFGQFSKRSIVSLKENAHLIASYFDGVPFAAYSDIPGSDSKFVGLNYPPITSRVHRFGINPMVPTAHFLSAAVKFSVGICEDD